MKLLLLVLSALMVSCSSVEQTHNGQANQVSVSSAVPSYSPQNQGIRSIDFRNFAYEWTPKWDRTPRKVKNIALKNGEIEAGVLPNGSIGSLGFFLGNVTYGELTGDNSEEAVVTLAIDSGGNSMSHVVFTYTFQNNKPKMLWVHETGDRADGGIRNLYVDNGTLVIEQYNLEKVVIDGDEIATTGLCCPRSFTRSYYKWNGQNFDKVKSETAGNEFGSAKILLPQN